jgi:GT2 family glycosyltransferase
VACCAPCSALDENGNHRQWYGDPTLWDYNQFCMAVRRAKVIAIGGYTEQFRGYGYEDNSFSWRLGASGVVYQWAKDTVVQHQWHPGHPSHADAENEKYNQELGAKEIEDYYKKKTRTLESNVGIEWGRIDS